MLVSRGRWYFHDMMKRSLCLFIALTVWLRADAAEERMAPAAIAARLELAADWQIAHPARHDPKDWVSGAFYAGLSAWADLAGDARFQRELVRIGETNAWRPGPDPYNADDQAVGQAYVEAFLREPKPERIAPLRESFDYVLGHPKELWYWCDALFMGPPAWARMAQATGEAKYRDYALEFWATTTRLLYDKDERLYYRDESFIAQRGASGQKIFWSRGNGWVLAGLARLLDYLPKEHPTRAELEQQYRVMAERIAGLQQADGLWRSSLLEPEVYPAKEASGSAFFCFGLAWGINRGLLDRARYEPIVWRAWAALTECLDASGRLNHVQPIGAAPGKFPADSTEPYGVGAFLLAGCEVYRLAGGADPAAVAAQPAHVWDSGADDRMRWAAFASRMAEPVLQALAHRRLKKTMPVEAAVPAERAECTHLEAIARLLVGIAPWLELGDDGTAEGLERKRLATLARHAIDEATNPASPDFMNFNRGGQPLVDAAFLGQAILRAPKELGEKLEPRVRANVVAALKATRVIKPYQSNWLLFASMVEATLQHFGEPRDEERLREGIEKHRTWYVGDGTYGDGPEFHWDYYNAYVIQPMLVEILDRVGEESAEWRAFRTQVTARARRFAAVQERLIAPDGSFPVIGRSIAYRGGAMQGLAQAALRRTLPESVKPGQARRALTAVIHRTLTAPGTFDARGWLQIGLAGHQPALAERYISTGSLYLCSVIFLPLGLPANDPFWAEPASATTWERAWRGDDLPADHALREER